MDNNQLENLLKVAAERLGTTPDQLKSAAQSGDLSKMLGNASPEDAAVMSKVLNDPNAAKKMLDSEGAQKLKNLFDKK